MKGRLRSELPKFLTVSLRPTTVAQLCQQWPIIGCHYVVIISDNGDPLWRWHWSLERGLAPQWSFQCDQLGLACLYCDRKTYTELIWEGIFVHMRKFKGERAEFVRRFLGLQEPPGSFYLLLINSHCPSVLAITVLL